MDDEPLDEELTPKSKSQVKRDLAALRDTGRALVRMREDRIAQIEDEKLREAVLAAKSMRPGSALKRQIQYIGKLMRSNAADQAIAILELEDSASAEHNRQFHRLERWRDALIADDPRVLDEIMVACPQVDRQHLRQLTRAAQVQLAADPEARGQSRKLFRYLRELTEV